MDKLDYVLVGLAQLGQKNALKMLWERYGDLVMRIAVSQARKQQSDFSEKGESNKRREMSIAGKFYLHFADWIQNYDETCNVPLNKYLAQRIVWATKGEKRKNSKRAGFESVVDDAAFWNSEALVDEYSTRFADESEQSRMLEGIAREVASSPKLTRFFEHCCEVFQIYDKCEESEVAKRMGCSRPTVYNLFDQIRKHLKK